MGIGLVGINALVLEVRGRFNFEVKFSFGLLIKTWVLHFLLLKQ